MAQQAPQMRCRDGSVVHLADVDVHDDVKEVLTKLNFAKAPEVSQAELLSVVDVASKLMNAKQNNSGSIDYTVLPEQFQSIFQSWDLKKTGRISAKDLSAAAQAMSSMKRESWWLKKLVVGLVLWTVCLMCGVFGTTYLVVDLTKDMHAASNGNLITVQGETVRTSSADTQIVDGVLMLRDDMSHPVRTAAFHADRSLSSTIPDQDLMELQTILVEFEFSATNDDPAETTVHSASGMMALKVDGVSRIPQTAGSPIVMVHTSLGDLMLNDEDVSVSDEFHRNAVAKGIPFPTDNVFEIGGRRLQYRPYGYDPTNSGTWYQRNYGRFANAHYSGKGRGKYR